MAETTWINQDDVLVEDRPNRLKFVIGGVLIIIALVVLMANAIQDTSQLFITVEEYYAQPAKYAGKDLRLAGWVIGDSISFTQIDPTHSILEFDVVDDIENPNNILHIVAHDEPKPDTLQHQAQALAEGRMENGNFLVTGDLLLKCPTRYEELQPPIQ